MMKFHDKMQDESLIFNNEKRQIRAGISKFLPWEQKRKTEKSIERFFERFKEDYYANFHKGIKDKPHEMICSEYTTKLIIAALYELDADLKKMLGDDSNEKVVNIPFDSFERFRAMHPDKLLEILKAHDCVEEVVSERHQALVSRNK